MYWFYFIYSQRIKSSARWVAQCCEYFSWACKGHHCPVLNHISLFVCLFIFIQYFILSLIFCVDMLATVTADHVLGMPTDRLILPLCKPFVSIFYLWNTWCSTLILQETSVHFRTISPCETFWLCYLICVKVLHTSLWSHTWHSRYDIMMTINWCHWPCLSIFSVWGVAEYWLLWMDEFGNRWRWAQHWNASALHCQSFWKVNMFVSIIKSLFTKFFPSFLVIEILL